MDLLFFEVAGGNFGDDLNEWLWDELLPGWRGWAPDTVLVGVGTVLKKGFVPEDRHKLVLGSGVGYGKIPDTRARPDLWDIRAVRGPRTAKALGLPQERAIVDPAMLLPDLARFARIERCDKVIFVPHHASIRMLDWDAICAAADVAYVSPSGDPEEVIRRIAGARLVIAESMHAAIIADAFRVPWVGVSIARGFNAFKWNDWGESLGLTPRFHHFFPILRTIQKLALRLFPRKQRRPGSSHATPETDGEAAFRVTGTKARILAFEARTMLRRLRRSKGQLSETSALESACARFRNVLSEISRDYGAGQQRSGPSNSVRTPAVGPRLL